MASRYPLVLNGSQIQELQEGDSIAGNSSASESLKVTNNLTVNYREGSVQSFPNTIPCRDGNADLFANVFQGVASSAKYADLAEKYLSDAPYEEGTVVVFGGQEEITITEKYADTRVAGVISAAPAYLMNNESSGQAVALRGKVPVKVVGTVQKGDLLVTSNVPGYAQAGIANFSSNAVFAKSLDNKDSNDPGVITAVIL